MTRAAVALLLVLALLAGCAATIPGQPLTAGAPGGPGTPSATTAVEPPAFSLPALPAGSANPAAPTSVTTTGRALPASGGTTPGTAVRSSATTGAAAAVPTWVRPGVRISWYVAGATVGVTQGSWVEDPNGPYVDERTGKHYKNVDTGTAGSSGGGDGVSQLDVLGVSGAAITYRLNLYGLDRSTGLWTVAAAQSATTNQPPDNAWVPVATLAGLAGSSAPGLLLLKGPYPLGGKTYDSVSVVNPTAGAYSSITYDLGSGLLLAATTATAGTSQPAGGQAPQTGTEMTVVRLAGLRQTTIPGLGGHNPAWTASGETLNYSGTWSWVNPVDASSGSTSAAAAMTVTIAPVAGSGWAQYTSKLTAQTSLVTPASTTGVTGPAGQFWIDPAALAALRSGTTLDTDPITTQTLAVKSADGSSVVLDSEIRGVSTLLQYDRNSGRLVALRQSFAGTGQTYQLQLAG